MKAVIFLDFDGVLHATAGPAAAMRQFVWLPFLMDIIKGHEVGIVVHASARQNSPSEFLHGRTGIPDEHWMGVTHPSQARWKSIQSWLAAHPEVAHHCILDDQLEEFPSPPPVELIHCNGTLGLSDKSIQSKIKSWLGLCSI